MIENEDARPWVLRTDILSIDGMFRSTEHRVADVHGGIWLPDVGISTCIAIVGQQGTGKSVLAMHIATRYLADCHAAFGIGMEMMPRVCYISTNMTFPVANPMVHRFGLDRPNDRHLPFSYDKASRDPEVRLTPEWLRLHKGAEAFEPDVKLGLWQCPADHPKSLARYLLGKSAAGLDQASSALRIDIAFVDLASRTTGDDWGFVHRLLSVLSLPHPEAPRHLVVVDATEGLEPFGGERNAFGEASVRRARVVKLLRQAAGKCHLVLIVEETISDKVLPEESVSDVVLRLRNVDEHGYLRRTLQIEKARGQAIVRGRHPYTFENTGLVAYTAANQPQTEMTQASGSRVFVIHGHDHSNALRLKELLRDRFHVDPVILSDAPGQGRTIIEKFEEEAAGCDFAIALLTPDDQIVTPAGEFTQSRPNVVFELGWFYGRIGRDRVVILMKHGTQIHSDLGGIERYEFVSDVREQAFRIEDELRRVGIVPPRA
jgi:hypothetical protein